MIVDSSNHDLQNEAQSASRVVVFVKPNFSRFRFRIDSQQGHVRPFYSFWFIHVQSPRGISMFKERGSRKRARPNGFIYSLTRLGATDIIDPGRYINLLFVLPSVPTDSLRTLIDGWTASMKSVYQSNGITVDHIQEAQQPGF